MLNLACTNKIYGAFVKGKYYFFVGDSSSGKTFLSLTCLAEAAINPNFDNYRLIHDDVEGGALMNIEKFFGKKLADRIEPPNGTKENPICSSSIEDFYDNISNATKKAIKDNTPFIYILDSQDALTSESEISKFEENKKARSEGKAITGSYGDGKARKHSSGIRQLLSPLNKSGSILLVINQTRDNLGFGHEKKTRSGGHALRFYACLEIWSSIYGKIHKTVRGKKRQIGIECLCKIKKNRIQGNEAPVKMPIYRTYGIDDVGSCIDYLIDEKHWGKKGSIINAKEFNIKGSKEKIARHIEKNSMEKDLQLIVGDVWNEIEEACNVGSKRKKRYE